MFYHQCDDNDWLFSAGQIARLADTYVNWHIGASGNRGQFSPSRRGGHIKFPPSRSFQGFRGGKRERPPVSVATNQSKEAKPTPITDQSRFVRRCWGCQSTNHLTIRIVHRAGSLGHRHDTVIVFRLHLLIVQLKISHYLTVCVIGSCVILRVWLLRNSVMIMITGNSQKLIVVKMLLLSAW